ncbi:PAS-domain containing protein [Thalassococcus sp. S3]|uniref:hybrid sensor histidine kinase/response regulator n=1 Tax=Thalassococcus sp. S3 TaxID=2017482 RepID=UPI0010240EE0|nr:PAS-domain containing protein [Thalassococcus sp. S3]QBF30603.1 hybrid sensor histidine kinase/response regulator [Thalassococcus sp. S3]
MPHNLVDPNDSLERQNEKLMAIAAKLMRRVEQGTDESGAAYAQFQRAALLEEQVRTRTHDLERALDLLNESNAKLAEANRQTETARADLTNAIETVQEGFALFNSNDVLVMCNSRFGMHMPDIRDRMVPGLRFDDYVDLVSHSKFLFLPKTETPEQWAKRRMLRHRDEHVIFNARMIWDRWVQVSEHRTPDRGTVILQTDVTDIMLLERQQRDRLLDDQTRLIRATLEHLNQGVCIFDSNSRLAGWNQKVGELLSIPVTRFRTGIGFNALFDRLREDVQFSDGMALERVERWVASQKGRKALSFEMTLHGSRVLDVFAQEMPDRGFVISFTDITAEREAVQAIREANETLEQRVMERTLELEDALAEAERANASKSRFVAAASHDLLQPLSAAKLYVSSVEHDVEDPQAKTILAKANRALLSVEHILEALLDISKLDSGRASVDIGPVSLDVLLHQLTEELLPLARQKGLSLRCVPTNAIVESDPSYLRRVLQNLMANAVRYTHDGKVLIGARHRGNTVRLEIWDTGPGIPEDMHDVIFGEFQRLNASASAAEGMGLGLAIVERACALLHHPLQVQSRVGQGTVFSVELNRSESVEERPRRAKRRKAPEEQRFQNLIVLLIENDAEMRNALTVSLEQWGVDVLACSSEEEASALLAEIGVAPDIVIADYQLDHDLNGLDAVARIRREMGDIPACIITADRSSDARASCAAAGLQVIHKPIDTNTLRQFLTSHSQPQHRSAAAK